MVDPIRWRERVVSEAHECKEVRKKQVAPLTACICA